MLINLLFAIIIWSNKFILKTLEYSFIFWENYKFKILKNEWKFIWGDVSRLKKWYFISFQFVYNEKNKISKLKLRTLLFSFILYKSGSGEINQFIEEQTSEDQEFFTYDEVCRMINFKLRSAKEKESDELFGFIASNKNDTYLS